MYNVARPVKKRRRGRYFVLLLLMLGGYTAWSLSRPLPALMPDLAASQLQIQTTPSKLVWLGSNQAAVGLLGTSILETAGNQKPVPTASVAKVITALVVLEKKPLRLNQPSPLITITAADVTRYNAYVAQNGSVVRVVAGKQLSQYQMLQALLLPSANNIADSLAIWAFGSLDGYRVAANDYLKRHGLTDTRVGSDASGLSPDTTSTASDMVKIGQLAMKHPVIFQVVGLSSVDGFPEVGTIKNVNFLLGSDGIIGIKTGNSDQAGGTFLGAATVNVNGKPEVIITSVLQAPNRLAAMQQSQALIRSAQLNFQPVSVIKKDTVVGTYSVPWGGRVNAVASQDLNLSAWGGSQPQALISLEKTSQKPRVTETVGSVTAQISPATTRQKVDIKLKTTPTEPSAWWRLTHPLE